MNPSARISTLGGSPIAPGFNPAPQFGFLSAASFEKTAQGWKGSFQLTKALAAVVELQGDKASYRLRHNFDPAGPWTTLRPDQAQELTAALTRWMASKPGVQKEAMLFNNALRKLWKRPIEKLPTSVSNAAGTSARLESPAFWLNSMPGPVGPPRPAQASFLLAGEAAHDAHPGFTVEKVEVYEWTTKKKVREVESPKPESSGVVGRGTRQQRYSLELPQNGLEPGRKYVFVVSTRIGKAPKLETLRTEPVRFEQAF